MHAAYTSHLNASPTDTERFRDRDQDEYSLLELGHQDDAMWEMRGGSAFLDLNMSNLSHGFNSIELIFSEIS